MAYSAFQAHFQLVEGMIPLLGDSFERPAGFIELSRLELPETFTADFNIVYQSGLGENLQVLGDSLPCDGSAGGELGDGERAAGA